MKTTTKQAEEVRLIAPEKVHVSAQNTRQPVLKDVKASGLLDSMRAQGQLTPGLGRPHPKKKGEVELAAGACRLIACRELGCDFRVIVREMTDAELSVIALAGKLEQERNVWKHEAETVRKQLDSEHENAIDWFIAYQELKTAVADTLEENRHLADGDQCTLKKLKDAYAKANSAGHGLDSENKSSHERA